LYDSSHVSDVVFLGHPPEVPRLISPAVVSAVELKVFREVGKCFNIIDKCDSVIEVGVKFNSPPPIVVVVSIFWVGATPKNGVPPLLYPEVSFIGYSPPRLE